MQKQQNLKIPFITPPRFGAGLLGLSLMDSSPTRPDPWAPSIANELLIGQPTQAAWCESSCLLSLQQLSLPRTAATFIQGFRTLFLPQMRRHFSPVSGYEQEKCVALGVWSVPTAREIIEPYGAFLERNGRPDRTNQGAFHKCTVNSRVFAWAFATCRHVAAREYPNETGSLNMHEAIGLFIMRPSYLNFWICARSYKSTTLRSLCTAHCTFLFPESA